MTAEKKTFQAEVSRLLEIVAHSLYSNKDVFLRELISNASDACDRLRYLAITEPKLIAGDAEFRVTIVPDKAKRTVTVMDNGIGMSGDELVENLGTIARSGTAAFMQQLSGDARKDMALIGQFGVGFYSAFMVAKEVEVVSRKAGAAEAWRWVSDGKGEYSVEPADKGTRGTTITLHLHDEDADYADAERLKRIVATYSDNVALPIVLEALGKKETLNQGAALWTRPRGDITEEQYREFYHAVGHGFDDPWLTLHAKAEGTYEYASLLFVPSTKPFDLFDPQRKNRVRLYVRRVFITDDCQELIPAYLRFVKGIVDSEDLPLNVSREMLQKNPMLTRMRTQLTRRLLSELQKKAKDAPEEYAKFWDNFGAVLKEGLYEDQEQRDSILELARFRSTAADGLATLDEYVARMKEGQTDIYTITGDAPESVARSPQLEGFRARGIEVLLLTDPVDEFWAPSLGQYKGHGFKSVTRGAADLDRFAPAEKKEDAKADGATASLIALFKLSLGEAVKDVRASNRLTDSAVCLVADEGDIDIRLERLLKQHRQLSAEAKRILEINPKHPLIQRLAELAGREGAADSLRDFAWLLLD
ncbi:MAG: molecular chaperone HtpG, partial [Stellaceae bacterium]